MQTECISLPCALQNRWRVYEVDELMENDSAGFLSQISFGADSSANVRFIAEVAASATLCESHAWELPIGTGMV